MPATPHKAHPLTNDNECKCVQQVVVESQLLYVSLELHECAVCADDGIDDPVDEDDVQHQLQDEGIQDREREASPCYLGDGEACATNEELTSLNWNVLSCQCQQIHPSQTKLNQSLHNGIRTLHCVFCHIPYSQSQM